MSISDIFDKGLGEALLNMFKIIIGLVVLYVFISIISPPLGRQILSILLGLISGIAHAVK